MRRRERRSHPRGRHRSRQRVPYRWLCVALLALATAVLVHRTPWVRPAPPPPSLPPPLSAYAHPNAALTTFGTLPGIAPGVLARQLSSVDPTEHNNDGSPANILYKTPQGASVIFSATGPGVVDDIWVAGSLRAMGDIRIIVDGQTPPAVDMPATEFFSGTSAPFITPLVGNSDVSSGGNYSYVPIAFQKSCVIAFTGTTAYWHVGFHRLPPGAAIRPFSPTVDLRAAATVWAGAGQDPHAKSGTRLITGAVDLPAGGSRTLARISGSGRIDALDLTVPAAAVPPSAPLTRSGLAFTGSSSFTLHIDPNNAGVRLVRRFDYALPDQTAQVYVDGALAGRFSSPGSTNGPYFWRDASVTLPARLTAGHSRIEVTIANTAPQPFTAFTYWAYPLTGQTGEPSDTLQMTPASETAHAFTVQHVLWRRSLSSSYVPAALADSRRILDQIMLQVHFDGSAAPAVDAPLGLFFGSGFGGTSVRSLMLAVDPGSGTLASFWPMPFARSATVSLVNRGMTPVPAIRYRIRFRPQPSDAVALAGGTEGYFHATYNRAAPTTPGHDYVLLAAAGTGKLVGVSLAMSTPPGMPYGLDNLQGNEQIYVDGNPTPAYLGTGTEDFFQGGWYFENGPFTLPTHGSPAQWVGSRYTAHISAYRLFLTDAIPFYDGIHAGIQVGPVGNLSADYSSVAFWYGQPSASLTQTDTLLPADTASAAAHDYSMAGGGATGPLTSVFQGRRNATEVTATGTVASRAAFTVRVAANNNGVLLRAQFDQCPGHQAAAVYVGNTYVGLWSDPGGNCTERWKDSSFLLPAAVTRGQTSLRVHLIASPGPGASPGPPLWKAFAYDILSFTGRPG